MIDVGNFEKKRVSTLNNELFLAAKKIMEEGTEAPLRCRHIGWASVGDYIDWLEENYEIKRIER